MLALCGPVPVTASAAECPNEQLRVENNSTQLPDCRAYEQVTPTYKQALDAFAKSLSSDGNALAFESQGNFAGSLQNSLFNNYLARRGAHGWQAEPTAPATKEYEGRGVADYSADLSKELLELRKPTQSSDAVDYYLREANGTLTEIGPSIPTRAELAPPGVLGSGSGGNALYLGASADLSHMIFETFTSTPESYFPGDETNFPATSVYEYVGTGNSAPSLIALDNNGALLRKCGVSVGHPSRPSLSRDGRRIFFDLEPCGENPETPYARVDGTTTVDLASSLCTRTAGDPGGACNEPSSAVLVGAGNNSYTAYYTTRQQLVNSDIDEGEDLYACTLPEGSIAPQGSVNSCPSLEPVSVTGTANGANVLSVADISEDGSRVAFVATGVLNGSGPNAAGDSAVEGADNLYVFNRDGIGARTRFVGALCSGSGMSGSVADARCPAAPGAVDGNPIAQMAPADGRYLVFTTFARLDAGDTDEAQDVYRYDNETGSLDRISAGHAGYSDNGNATEINAAIPDTFLFVFGGPAETSSYGEWRRDTAVSENGERIFFTTNEALDPRDTNGQSDVYEWENGQVSLISDGVDPLGSSLLYASPSGDDVTFKTIDQLTWEDGDTLGDVYDARVDGGFPVATGPTICSGEVCQGSPSTPATFSLPGSIDLTGSGNQSAGGGPPGSASQLSAAVSRRIAGAGGELKINVPGSGKLTASGAGLKRIETNVSGAGAKSIKLVLTKKARARLQLKGTLKTKLKVVFTPSMGGAPTSVMVLLTFRNPRHKQIAPSAGAAGKGHS